MCTAWSSHVNNPQIRITVVPTAIVYSNTMKFNWKCVTLRHLHMYNEHESCVTGHPAAIYGSYGNRAVRAIEG